MNARNRLSLPTRLPCSLWARCFALFFLAAMLSSASGAEARWRVLYEDGLDAFEARDLGKALQDFQDAIVERRTGFEKAVASIAAVSESAEAKHSKDSIHAFIETKAKTILFAREISSIHASAAGSLLAEAEALKARNPDRLQSNFLEALISVLDARGEEAIRGSLKRLEEEARLLKAFPEAEYGLGKVFLAEGELKLAAAQFERALSMAASLEIPEGRSEFLDSLASVQKSLGDLIAYEATLRQELMDLSPFGEKEAFLRQAMERSLVNEGFDTFARLYRIDEIRVSKPAAELGEYLLRRGRSQAVIHLAISANAVITRALTEIRRKEPSYQYIGLHDLASALRRQSGLEEWTEKSGLWKCLYYLAEALAAQPVAQASKELFLELSSMENAGAWAAASRQALLRKDGKPSIFP